MTIDELKAWARARAFPDKLIERLDQLATRSPPIVREIADEFAELGYAWTANELREQWCPTPPT